MSKKTNTTKAIKLTEETHKLMVLAKAKVTTETDGKITTMPDALEYILKKWLK